MLAMILALLIQEEAPRRLSIQIPADGKPQIRGSVVEWADLEDSLKTLAAQNYGQALLDIDSEVPFSSVSRVMDACKRAGIEHVEFAAAKVEPAGRLVGGEPTLRIKIRDSTRGRQVIVMQEAPVGSMTELREMLSGLKAMPVIIDADYETSYGLVQDVAKACVDAGFSKMSFAASLAARPSGTARNVLYVEHWPRWEFRFLKNALIRDPNMRAHILLTSSDSSFPQDATPGLEPIQAFPADLGGYDVLILGDVPLDALGEGAAERIVEFVKEGGGLLLIAGAETNPIGYAGTPLEGLLPVVPGKAPERDAAREYAYRLTKDGDGHVVTSLHPTADKNRSIWRDAEQLPPIRYAIPGAAREGATVLVEALHGDRADPLFVTMPVEKGRVFYSATDEAYRWRWLRGDAPYFYPFYQRAVDWAAGDH